MQDIYKSLVYYILMAKNELLCRMMINNFNIRFGGQNIAFAHYHLPNYYPTKCLIPYYRFKSSSIEKINIWDQIRLIINSKVLSNAQKQYKLDMVKSFHIPTDNGNGQFEEGPVSQLLSIIIEVYPLLYKEIQEKIKPSKKFKISSDVFFNNVLKLTLYFLTVTLKNKETIAQSMFTFHLTLISSRLIKFYHANKNSKIDKQIAQDEVNEVGQINMKLAQIDASKFDDIERASWKLMHTFVELLIHHDFLKRFSEESSSKSLSSTKKNPGKLNTIALNGNIRKKINPLLTLFMDKGPQVTVPSMSKRDKDHHSQLSEGFSSLSLNKLGRKSLSIASKSCMFYNYDLYKLAKRFVEDETFNILNNSKRETLELELNELRPEVREVRVIKNTYIRIEQLSTIQLFFQNKEELLYDGVHSLCPKKSIKDHGVIPLNLLSKVPKKYVVVMIQDILMFIIYTLNQPFEYAEISLKEEFSKALEKYGNTSKLIENYIFLTSQDSKLFNPDILSDFDLPSSFLNYFKELFKTVDNDFNSTITFHIEALRGMIALLHNIGIYKLSNLALVAKAVPQKSLNIFKLWAMKVFRETYSHNYTILVLEEVGSIETRYLEKTREYGIYVSASFKEKLMDLYKSIPFYLQPKITVNGRLTYVGYSAHPHAGVSFRFVETKPELINPSGLKFLYIAGSCSLGNKFKTFDDHYEGIQNNLMEGEITSKKSIPSFIYSEAHSNVQLNKPIGTMIRVDQLASALTYGGFLSGCEVLLKATNIGQSEEIVDPYTLFGKQYLEPTLVRIKLDWVEKIIKLKNITIKEGLIYVLENVLIPGCRDRSLLKALIMPHAYGLTSTGIGDILISYIKPRLKNLNISTLKEDSGFSSLELKIGHSLNDISSPRKVLQHIIMKTYVAIQAKSKDNFSTRVSFSDLSIEGDYKEKDLVKKSRGNKDLGYSESTYIHQFSSKNNTAQNIRSFLPLLVHSIDAAVIRCVLRNCAMEFGFTPITIHDCAMCHPNYMEKLLMIFKRSIYEILGSNELTNKVFLEKIGLNKTLESLCEEDKREIIYIGERSGKERPMALIIIKSDHIFKSPYNFSFE